MANSKQTLRISLNFSDERFFCADYGRESTEHLAFNKTTAEATVEALAVWGLQADEVDVTYHSSCHFMCHSNKCIVPATPRGDCPHDFYLQHSLIFARNPGRVPARSQRTVVPLPHIGSNTRSPIFVYDNMMSHANGETGVASRLRLKKIKQKEYRL